MEQKLKLLLAIILIVIIGKSYPAGKSVRQIIIVAGQSNALNWHCNAKLLPKDDSTDKKIPFYYHTGLPPKNSNPVPINGTSKNKWVTLKYQSQNPYIALNADFFGPEISLARRLYKAGKEISVIKCTYAGTSLAGDWMKNLATGNGLYNLMMGQVDTALMEISKQGYETKIIAFFWMQGESDAENATKSASYKTNIIKFIGNLRTDFHNDSMKFILGRIGNKSSYAYKEAVRKAQVEITATDPLIKWVNTDDQTYDTDNIHLLAPGVITLGERMADSLISIKPLEVKSGVVSSNYFLSSNYPNPFNPSTTIEYYIPAQGLVSLKVYDLLGREISTLVNEYKLPGAYKVEFNPSDKALSSGIYLYKLSVNNFLQSGKMIYAK